MIKTQKLKEAFGKGKGEIFMNNISILLGDFSHYDILRRHCSSDEDEFDTSIDAKLKQSAMRNNLTPQNVKNILQVGYFFAVKFHINNIPLPFRKWLEMIMY